MGYSREGTVNVVISPGSVLEEGWALDKDHRAYSFPGFNVCVPQPQNTGANKAT